MAASSPPAEAAVATETAQMVAAAIQRQIPAVPGGRRVEKVASGTFQPEAELEGAGPTAVRITPEARHSAGRKWVRLRYRSVNQQLDYRTLAMRPTGKPGPYAAVVSGERRVTLLAILESMTRAAPRPSHGAGAHPCVRPTCGLRSWRRGALAKGP